MTAALVLVIAGAGVYVYSAVLGPSLLWVTGGVQEVRPPFDDAQLPPTIPQIARDDFSLSEGWPAELETSFRPTGGSGGRVTVELNLGETPPPDSEVSRAHIFVASDRTIDFYGVVDDWSVVDSGLVLEAELTAVRDGHSFPDDGDVFVVVCLPRDFHPLRSGCSHAPTG